MFKNILLGKKLVSCIILIIMSSSANASLTYIDHNVGEYGLVYDSTQNITWTQLGELSPTAYSWGNTNTLVHNINAGVYGPYYGVSGGGWRLPTITEMNTLYHELPSSNGNKTGTQVFGSGSNDYFNIPFTASYWSAYEIGTNLVNVYSFSSGIYTLKLESLVAYAWLVHDGNLAPVPIPTAFLLFGSALAGLSLFSKRRLA